MLKRRTDASDDIHPQLGHPRSFRLTSDPHIVQ